MGVGYIIGYRSAAIMVGGGLLSWLVLIPAIALFGEGRPTPLYPATVLISDMAPVDIWSRYIRYIGAGAVAAGGIINLLKAMPTIVDSLPRLLPRPAPHRRRARRRAAAHRARPAHLDGARRARWPSPSSWPSCPSSRSCPAWGSACSRRVAIIVFGFFFSVVSSRITGELGSLLQPGQRHGHRHPDGRLPRLHPAGLDRARLHRGRPVHRRHRLHRVQQRRHHQPGPEDQLPGGGHALAAAGRDHRGRAHQRGRDRLDAAVHQPELHRSVQEAALRSRPAAVAGGADARPDPTAQSYRVARAGGHAGIPDGTYLVDDGGPRALPACRRASAPTKAPAPAGHPDEPRHQGHPHPAAPLGLRAARRLHLDPDGDHRRARPGLRGGHVPAPGEHHPDLHRRPRAQARGLEAGHATPSRTRARACSSARGSWPAARSWASPRRS